MNRERRKALTELNEQFETLSTQLEELKGAEEESLENMPESFQDGERGEKMREAVEQLETAMQLIEELTEAITSAKGEG